MFDNKRRINSTYLNAEIHLRNRDRRIWCGSSALVVGLTFALFAVFAWGLQYKLSLYNPPERSKPTMPAAKLLSPKERPVIQTQSHLQRPPSKLLPVELILFLGGFLPLFFERVSTISIPLHRAVNQIRETPTIYSRPPPSRS